MGVFRRMDRLGVIICGLGQFALGVDAVWYGDDGGWGLENG